VSRKRPGNSATFATVYENSLRLALAMG
jgi:hypothetical protein